MNTRIAVPISSADADRTMFWALSLPYSPPPSDSAIYETPIT